MLAAGAFLLPALSAQSLGVVPVCPDGSSSLAMADFNGGGVGDLAGS